MVVWGNPNLEYLIIELGSVKKPFKYNWSLLVKLSKFDDVSKSNVASSSTAVGASFTPFIWMTISAVDVCPVSSVTV